VDNVYFHPTNLGVYTHKPPRFWRRQFNDSPTRAQFRFDIAFGLIIPVLCFVFDPVVFRGWLIGEGFYHRFQFLAYAASTFEITTLGCWLFVVRKYPAWSRPAGGVMLAGALLSGAIGLAILPFSFMGLLFAGLGALGFIPFISAIVYLRNGLRAIRLNRTNAPVPGAVFASFAFGILVALGIPVAAQVGAERAVRLARAELLAGEELSTPRRRIVRLITRASGEQFDDIVREYAVETDPERKQRLAHIYVVLTGKSIEQRYQRWMD
jgi:hypothetical protein